MLTITTNARTLILIGPLSSAALECGANSHYNACAEGCQDVCSSMDLVGACGSCEERCVCDPGFKLSGGMCVLVEDCGCWNNGRHYEKGVVFIDEGCTQRCQCLGNGQTKCSTWSCADNEICKDKGGVKGCFLPKIVSCSVYGDPHYITFDNRAYNFQGGCNYTLVTTEQTRVQFNVTGRNVNPTDQNLTRSKLDTVVLQIQELHLTLNQNGNVYVHSNLVQLPYSSNGSYGSLKVYRQRHQVVVETNVGLRMMIDGKNRLFLQVDERYEGKLRGLCGTYSDWQGDDFVKPDWSNATGPFDFGNSWRVTEDSTPCIAYPDDPKICDEHGEVLAYRDCGALLGDSFSPCYEYKHPQMYIASCVYDHCATNGDLHTLCDSLESYVVACEVAGGELPDWKNNTACEGYYMYIEADGMTHGDSSRLLSPQCEYRGPVCLQFWYHMYGSATAMALNIYKLKLTAEKIWSMANNQGPEWRSASVDIKDSGSFQIIIEAIRGSDALSDVAIDDISIHYGSCKMCSLDCSFNGNLCDWSQTMTDAFDWTLEHGSTPTLMTGPSADHTGDGHYLYIEANSATYGDTARVLSSECSHTGPQCLQFWYHMYGSADTMGLNVYLLQDRVTDAVWQKRNNQGNVWHKATVDFTPTRPFQIIIEGRRGSNDESDVAIDDVSLHPGHCAVCKMNCDFDQNLCEWNQLVTDAFDWTRHNGSTPTIMTGPSSDHTAGDGHYLYIEANSATYGDTARLLSSECSHTGPQCLQFWYHMYGSADTMGLRVYLLQDRVTDAVWQKRNDQGNVWHKATVDFTPTGPFQIIIEGRRGSNDESDVAIDDVSLHPRHCADGHYLYIEANSATYGDTARVLSSECSHTGPQCLQFWYHMYGSADTMGLHVYLLQDRVTDAVWQKRNDQGNVWHKAIVDFTPTGPFQIIIEGRRGSNDESDVAIDDVSLHPRHCAVCKMNCDFDQNLCEWNQLVTDAFDWTRHNGSTPTIMTGPSSDHTAGDGHYLYIEANSATYGDTARVLSSECSHTGPQCLQFWYHMYGSADTMGLHVYLLQDRVTDAVWQKRNDQGNVWHKATVDFTPTGPFQIIIEGRRGSNDESDVAIDDVSLHPGHCAVCKINCDFDQNLCEWNQLVTDAFDWTRHNGSTPTIMTGPSSDHTAGDGHYLYIEANSATYGDTARVLSSECSHTGPQCLQFWYHMYGSADTMGLHVYLLQDRVTDAVWQKRNDQGNVWHKATVDFTPTGPFQIIIEGRRGSNDESDVAIDDVSLHPGHCAVCKINCDFDQNLCEWNQLVTDAFDWTRHNGSTPTIMTGPSSDHTAGDGHYLYIEANSATYGDTARVLSSECSHTGPQCLQFWYHMYGSADTMGLHVYLLQDRVTDAVWQKKNDQGNVWHKATVDFTPTGPFQIIIEGRRGSNDESDVAIDDVSLHPGHCAVCKMNCDFDQNLCEWNQLVTDAFDWTRHNGSTPTIMTGPSSDHTAGDGHYLYIEANSATYGDTARVLSSECSHTGPQCLQFWYHMYGSADTMGLNVYLLQDRVTDAVWQKKNDQGNVWHKATVDFTPTGPFQIIIEGRRGSNDESDVAIDDVSLHPGHCAVCKMNCDFDQNLCEWNQLVTDAFDWTRHNGSTPTIMTGPSSDHTAGDGHYLYIEANSATYGDTARLLSSECSHTGPQCLQFWYHMYGSADTMGLNVYLLQDRLADAVWQKRNDQGNVWHEAVVDFTPTGPFQVCTLFFIFAYDIFKPRRKWTSNYSNVTNHSKTTTSNHRKVTNYSKTTTSNHRKVTNYSKTTAVNYLDTK
ncbi:MAM and LDL-receptor class A domain-containing protein 2 [Merluccius polli]|uniref:MAM and LDL-receptor class A domain-containing protein 2 n=1 Tax=Merluccius polli TaxID=89951 RepID=A0AA47MBE4_MERPO|nr:MAM and LDL-receptor class A domain-containing protein 2 [Merluccius polli]